jgi:hypothetical protein
VPEQLLYYLDMCGNSFAALGKARVRLVPLFVSTHKHTCYAEHCMTAGCVQDAVRCFRKLAVLCLEHDLVDQCARVQALLQEA